MSTASNQNSATTQQQGMPMTSEQLKALFDVFMSKLKTRDTSSLNVSLIKQITSTLINLPNECEELAKSKLITHQLMIFLRDSVIIDQLRRRQTKDIAYDLLVDFSTVLANICHRITDTNIRLFEELLLHQSLIDELSNCLDEISTTGQHLDNPQLLNSIRLILTAFRYYEAFRYHKETQRETDKSTYQISLVSAITRCLCSPYTIDVLSKLKHNFSQKLSEKELLLLSTCPHYIYWSSGDHTPELFIQIPRTLLRPFTKWATTCKPKCILNCSEEFRDMMRHMNFLLVRPIDWDAANISSTEFSDDYYKLVSQWSSFLQTIIRQSEDDYLFKSIGRFILQDLYNFSFHSDVVTFMKSIPDLISLLLKMADIQQDETQLNAFRCLGKLMTEDDIKTMFNSAKIATIYVKFLSSSIDTPRLKARFYSLLESSKSKYYIFYNLIISNIQNTPKLF